MMALIILLLVFINLKLAIIFIVVIVSIVDIVLVYWRTPNDKDNSSIRASITSKRHRTPDTSSAKRSFVKVSLMLVDKDCYIIL